MEVVGQRGAVCIFRFPRQKQKPTLIRRKSPSRLALIFAAIGGRPKGVTSFSFRSELSNVEPAIWLYSCDPTVALRRSRAWKPNYGRDFDRRGDSVQTNVTS